MKYACPTGLHTPQGTGTVVLVVWSHHILYMVNVKDKVHKASSSLKLPTHSLMFTSVLKLLHHITNGDDEASRPIAALCVLYSLSPSPPLPSI